jgi:hypothetical protein
MCLIINEELRQRTTLSVSISSCYDSFAGFPGHAPLNEYRVVRIGDYGLSSSCTT